MPVLNAASPTSLPNGRFIWYADTGIPIGATDGPFTIGDLLMVLGSTAGINAAAPLWYRCTGSGNGNVATWATMGGSVNVTTTDPGTSNDITQGYQPGSVWINTALNREWTCLANAAGAAIWSFAGAAYTSGGYNPAGEVTQAGNSTGTFAEEGNINRQVTQPGVIPGGVGADFVLFTYTLPANAFDIGGRGISLFAAGTFAANGNVKRVKIVVGCTTATVGSAVTGGTVIADTNSVGSGGLGWAVAADVYKANTGSANMQVGIHQQAQYGTLISPLLAPVATLTMSENSSILIAVTGNAVTNSNDITAYFMQANWMN